jgi:hypothetical protein
MRLTTGTTFASCVLLSDLFQESTINEVSGIKGKNMDCGCSVHMKHTSVSK